MMTTLPAQLFAAEATPNQMPIQKVDKLDTETTTPAGLEVNQPVVFTGDGFEAEFKVVSKWQGAFNGEIKITNTGRKPIENWILNLKFGHEITNIWNADIIEHKNDAYTLKNKGWNADIQPGQSVTIGFGANYSDYINAPTSYSIPISNSDVKEEDYSIDFRVISDWGQAFNAIISIKNNTDKTIEDWTLEFDFDRNIQQFWTAQIESHEGNHYVIKNAGWNANINPGQTLELGFAGNPGNVNTAPINYSLIQIQQLIEKDYSIDSDGDGLPDEYEKIIGSSPTKVDTDEDGLPDPYECYQLTTSPIEQDTDNNGICDADEDFDADGLSNLQEYIKGTHPLFSDTDNDGLIDGEEEYYGADPLVYDTDKDGLSDGDEVLLGLDPSNADTDGDGILDAKEKIYQTVAQPISQEESPAVTKVEVSLAGNGNIQKTTRITNTYNIDLQSTDVVGLVGVPVDIYADSEFDEAKLTFTYDENLLGDTEEDDLAIMWYDEEDPWYHLLDSKVDKVNNTVSVTTTHFSTYLLVDKKQWKAAWDVILDYRGESNQANSFDIAFVLDESGSMMGTPYKNLQEGTKYFIDLLGEKDRATVISFDDSARCRISLTNDKEILKKAVDKSGNWGGTNIAIGIEEGITQLLKSNTNSGNKKIMILFTDGYGSLTTQNATKRAVENDINIFTIGIGTGVNSTLLELIAKETGGKYYQINGTEDLLSILYFIQNGTVADYDPTDNDNDDIPDVFETVGMRLTNGKIIFTRADRFDSDYDGLRDGQEMTLVDKGGKMIDNKPVGRYFIMYSHPGLPDSDRDTLDDKDDPAPLQPYPHDKYGIVHGFDYKPFMGRVEELQAQSDLSYGERKINTKDELIHLLDVKTRLELTTGGGFFMRPNAAKALNHFRLNTGKDYRIDNLDEVIKDVDCVRNLFNENLDYFIKATEGIMKNDDTLFIATIDKVQITNLSQRGGPDAVSEDWWFTLGDSFGYMVGKVRKTDNQYVMDLRYSVEDFYDWDPKGTAGGGLVLDRELYELHNVGWARHFRFFGTCKIEVRWNKGDRMNTSNAPKVYFK